MKKTLIALAAAATLAVGFSATAKADQFYFGVGSHGQAQFGVSVGSPGYGGPGYGGHGHGYGGYGSGYSPGYYNTGWGGPDCGPRYVKKWVWNPWAGQMVPRWKKVWTCY